MSVPKGRGILRQHHDRKLIHGFSIADRLIEPDEATHAPGLPPELDELLAPGPEGGGSSNTKDDVADGEVGVVELGAGGAEEGGREGREGVGLPEIGRLPGEGRREGVMEGNGRGGGGSSNAGVRAGMMGGKDEEEPGEDGGEKEGCKDKGCGEG